MELRDPIQALVKNKGGNVWSVPPSASVYDAIATMSEKRTANRVRHLPVIEDNTVAGIVSIGDLVNWIISAQANTIFQPS